MTDWKAVKTAVKLNRSERLMLYALRDFHAKNGYMPNTKELMHLCGWSVRSPVNRYLQSLNAKGAITYRPRALPVVLL